jgi:hypothetical protein
MKTKDRSYELNYSVEDAPKAKTVGLWVDVNDRNLETKIKRAFNLAKSAGQELDLTVSSNSPTQSALRQFPLR